MASASSHSAPAQICAVKTLNQTIGKAYSRQDSSRRKHDDRAAKESEMSLFIRTPRAFTINSFTT